MELMKRSRQTRSLFFGLTLAAVPVLSSCANFGLFQPQAPVAQTPRELPSVVEPPPQMAFPELAVGPQIVDIPDMVETPAASQPPVANRAPVPRPPAPRRAPPIRQASVQPPTPPVAAPPRTVEPADLVGFNFDSVLEVLRQPDAVEKDALSVVWSYSGYDCTLQLYFYPDIQTSVFRLLKYELKDSSGEKLNGGGACLQPMMASKDGSQSPR
jgi:hypothetical protein